MALLESLLDFAKSHVPFHQRRAPENHLNLGHWPLMTKHDLAAYSLVKSSDLLSHPRKRGGHIVASGGTTAKPKYIYYNHAEFAAVARNIANHFMANGMAPGDSVVNYFGSGDMWSAFILVDKVLSTLPVTVFPLGCTNQMDYSLEILERFEPNVIVGIPSMILELARYCADHEKNRVRIQKVFYAGEPMLPAMMDQLTIIWGCEHIRSAGYASTDVGSIGWQCLHCETGEHYAFDDTVVEIINSEIVVTSLTRRAMPIIRYCTGDRGIWVTPSCECGHGAPMFKLLGRIDNVVLIWGCRVLCDEIVAVFQELNNSLTAVQIHAYSKGSEQFLLVKFESTLKPEPKVETQLRDVIYKRCGDLSASVQREMLGHHLSFEAVPFGTLKRNERTGKVIPIIDSR